MLDVNAGIPLADEPAILAATIELVQSLTDVPLSIDSSIVAALEAGLAVYQGKALVNCVTGEDERIEQVLPLVAKHGAAVVAITNDETGISEDPDVRFEIAKKIVSARRRPRHRARGHRRRPARHADRRDRHGRAAGLRARAAARRRAARELDLRRVERQLRPAEPQRPERRVPVHGHRERHDVRHHEPAARGGPPGRHGRRRDDGQRPRLRARGSPATRGAGTTAGGRAARPRRPRGPPPGAEPAESLPAP